MKIIRGIVGGIVFGIIAEILGWLVYMVLFGKWVEQSSHLWRPFESLYWRVGMPLTDLLLGLMMALGYALLYKGIPGTGLGKGVAFGLIMWLISRVPGELFMYVMTPEPFILVIAGWLHGIITMVLGGLAIAAIFGKSLE